MMYLPGDTPEDRIEHLRIRHIIRVARLVEDAEVMKRRLDEDTKEGIFESERAFRREKDRIEYVMEAVYGKQTSEPDTD